MRNGRWAVLLGTALIAAACTDPRAVTPPPVASACGVASFSCVLPFPSDRFEVADATTRTGVRVEIPPKLFTPGLLDQLGPGARLADVLAGNDGFSALTPIVFQAADGIDPDSVPPDGDSAVQVVDAQGQRQAIRVEPGAFGTDERGRQGVLLIWPVTRWPAGAHLTATVGDAITDPDGEPAQWWDDSTTFTVGSTESITSDVDRMVSAVRQRPHPVRGLTVSPSIIGGALLVTGQVALSDFRDADRVIPRDGTATAHELWVDFLLTLPGEPASPAGAPVAIYGHGLSISKETAFLVAGQNAEHGVATIAIDVPLHGSRVPADGYLLSSNQPTNLGRVVSMVLQGELDYLSLLMAIRTSLASLDVSPPRIDGGHGDGRPDLDPSRVYYLGTSMGSVLGATFAGLAPELSGGFLQVGGAGVIDTIYHSILWGVFGQATPGGSPPGDAAALLAGAQTLMDRGDPSYYLDRVSQSGTPLFMVWAPDDGIVGNPSSDRLIRLAGLPVTRDVPDDGSGALLLPPVGPVSDLTTGFRAHLQFTSPEARAALDAWWERMLG